MTDDESKYLNIFIPNHNNGNLDFSILHNSIYTLTKFNKYNRRFSLFFLINLILIKYTTFFPSHYYLLWNFFWIYNY